MPEEQGASLKEHGVRNPSPVFFFEMRKCLSRSACLRLALFAHGLHAVSAFIVPATGRASVFAQQAVLKAQTQQIARCQRSGFVRVKGSQKEEDASMATSTTEIKAVGVDTDDLNARILSIAAPALGSLAIDPLLGVVDTLFVGRIPDAAPLAALGICSSIFNFSFFIFNFLATATTPIIARALAAGEREEAARTLGQALTLAVGLGISSTVIIELGAHPILDTMGTSEAAYSSAQSYLAIRALAAPAVLVASVGNGAFRGLLDTRTPLKILLAANLINLALDPILIFGVNAGSVTLVPALGAGGAAVATATAEWTSAAAFLWSLRQREEVQGGVRLLTRMPPVEETASLLRASGAIFLRTVAIQTVLTSATGEAARAGTAAVAAHQVAAQLWLLLSFVVDALAVAAQALVADEMGKGSVQRAREVGDRLVLFASGLGLVLGGGFVAFRPALPALFTADAGVAAAVSPLLLYVAVMQPINALVFVGDGVLQGSQDFAYLSAAMATAAACSLGVLWSGDGIENVWRALIVLQLVRAGGLAWRYYGGAAAGGPFNASEQQQE